MSTGRLCIGIDPGLSGAIVAFDGRSLLLYDMPTVKVQRNAKSKREVSPMLLASTLEHLVQTAEVMDYSPHVVLERVGAMPGQGVSSTFQFGRSTGMIEGVLAALKLPVTVVPPSTWQRAMNARGGKDAGRLRAQELFPKHAPAFARVKDDGRADAALMAAYCWKVTTQ